MNKETARRRKEEFIAGEFSGLSARSRHVLDRGGFKTVASVVAARDFDLALIRGCGPGTLAEIRRFVAARIGHPPLVECPTCSPQSAGDG